jgi:membrane carboxypeptidase/penicillin-binding protein
MRRALRIATKATLVLLLVLVLAVAAIAGRVIWYYEYEIGLPDHHRVANAAFAPVCSDGNRTFVPLADIPPIVKQAVLAAENADFYARSPINPFAEFARAILFEHKPKNSGISTAVTRCLMWLSPNCCHAIDWHIGNGIVMYRLERDITKDAIFEVYLNGIFVGRGSHGAAAAADVYFGKSLADLTLDEVAFIAAIPRGPSIKTSRDIDRATHRRNVILDRMTQTGAIDQAQAESAKQLQLRIREVPAPI